MSTFHKRCKQADNMDTPFSPAPFPSENTNAKNKQTNQKSLFSVWHASSLLLEKVGYKIPLPAVYALDSY